ncbi:MAG: hypothetical protein LC541_04560 [Candidatus Thiodiazotropha sp.]|nr:hypothetical protein [Candidatus Thiodiazotropha sp.]MCM8882589.1 hypothetical protein [Candidatus Thiodiazotropha sp.]
MRNSNSRLIKLEQKAQVQAAEREAFEAQLQAREERYAKEWEKYRDYMTRDDFDTLMRNQVAFYKRLDEKDDLPSKSASGAELELELDAANKRVMEDWSDEALERYNRRHIAYEAVYKQREAARAVEIMDKDQNWGGFVDHMDLIEKVLDEVTRELGFDFDGNAYPYDPTEESVKK